MSTPTCARAGCDQPVPHVTRRRGRPPISCSVQCRPSGSVAAGRIAVEVDQLDLDGDEHGATGRDWLVRIRRGHHIVVVARDLGRFSAMALAGELRAVLEPAKRWTRTIK